MERSLIKSHEYISRTVLKNFSFRKNNNDLVYYAKLPNLKIRWADIKKFNTKYGAYSCENEAILKNEIEDYVGRLVKKVNNDIKRSGRMSLSDFDLDKVKDYLGYQTIRDNTSMVNILGLSELFYGVEGRQNFMNSVGNTILGAKNYFLSQEPQLHSFRSVFKNDGVVVAFSPNGNLMGSNFIVNLSHDGSHNTIGIAITPSIVFILTLDFHDNLLLKYTHKAGKILSDHEVKYINYKTIRTGLNRNGGIIISGKEKCLLESIKAFNL